MFTYKQSRTIGSKPVRSVHSAFPKPRLAALDAVRFYRTCHVCTISTRVLRL